MFNNIKVVKKIGISVIFLSIVFCSFFCFEHKARVKHLNNVILFGKPASGKGTYGAMLAKEYNLYHLSAGQALRDCVNDKKCSHGEIIKGYINSGKLVPNNIINSVLRDYINKNVLCFKCNYNGIIFDGFPRQKETISFFKDNNIKIYKAINIDISDKEAIKRIQNRKDGRADDRDKKAILTRLNIYYTETRDVIDIFNKQKLLVNVNGVGKNEEVYNNIKKAVDMK